MPPVPDENFWHSGNSRRKQDVSVLVLTFILRFGKILYERKDFWDYIWKDVTDSESKSHGLEASGEKERYIHEMVCSNESKAFAKSRNSKTSFTRDIVGREQSGTLQHPRSKEQELQARRQIVESGQLKEHRFNVSDINKIFCSQWLSDRKIVFGTKSGVLYLLDVISNKILEIPEPPTVVTNSIEDQNSLFSVEINASRTLLITGSKNSHKISMFSIPTMEPLCLSKEIHRDNIFSLCWLDDSRFISASSDSTIVQWKVYNEFSRHPYIAPACVLKESDMGKMRALAYNERKMEVAGLSSREFLHLWDTKSLQKKAKIFHKQETSLCLCCDKEFGFYVIGSKSFLVLADSRCSDGIVGEVAIPTVLCGARSLSSRGGLVTIGTGLGAVDFYDVRAGRFLGDRNSSYSVISDNETRTKRLHTSQGWVLEDWSFRSVYVSSQCYNPAVFTHSYDDSGMRLFVGGGPLPCAVHGSYAAVFQ